MVCVKEDQAKEGTHAFTEECYHIQFRGSSVDIAVALASATNSPSVNGMDGWDCLIVALLFGHRCRFEQGREDFDYGQQ
jgi:hypothetical protein